jgi:OmpA family protein
VIETGPIQLEQEMSPTTTSLGTTPTDRVPTILFLALLLFFPSAASAQTGQMFIYPKNGQSLQKQDKDRYECHTWAVQQTGFDPSLAYPGNPNAVDPQPYRPSQPHVLKGAGRGAALGAVGGAIAGNAGKGAAAGAAMGGMAGGFRRLDERRNQSAAQNQQAQSQASQKAIAYQRAMAACLDGRGYSVK